MPRVNLETGLKVCSKCRKELAADLHFVKDKSTPDGYNIHCKMCRRGYNRADKERQKEYHKERYVTHKELIKKHQKSYRSANRERQREYRKRHYVTHKEYRKEYQKAYNKANPQVGQAANHRRRARMLRADDGTVTKDILRQMLDACGRRCMNPNCVTPDSSLSIDHVVALQRKWGKGKHSIFNIQILCRSCNSSKGHRRTVDYRPPDWPWLKPPPSN